MTRAERDFYPTPATAVYPLLKRVGRQLRRATNGDDYLEPAVGEGAILRAFRDFRIKSRGDGFSYPCPNWDTLDIEPVTTETISSLGGTGHRSFQQTNYLNFTTEKQYNVIITNPPFKIAQEFVEHSLALCPGYCPVVIMLLRLGFLGSEDRSHWWQGREPDAMYVLSQRPKFRGSGSDNADYAWFFWNWHQKGIFILEPWKE